ncbi:MAG: helix-turn-helix domain-containing protein [Luteolibacter sp.]
MATLSMDLRQRILNAYDRGDVTRDEVARRFEVSLGMVKKLLRQCSQLGSIEPLHHRSGRKPAMK